MLLNFLKLFLLVLLFTYKVTGQAKVESNLLQEELFLLRDIAIGTSPKLTEEEQVNIRDLINENSLKLEDESMDAIEFVNFFSGLDLQTQFDEHARIEIGEDVLSPLFAEVKLFPLPIKILDDQVVVNSENGEIPFGSVIHSINKQPIASVLESISKDKDTFTKRRTERQFSIINAIKNPSSDKYEIGYSEPLAQVKKEKVVEGMYVNDWVNEMKASSVFPLGRASTEELINTIHYKEHNAFYFQLNSFNWDESLEKGLFDKMSRDRKNFDKAFEKIFKEVNESGAEHLILDLRNNGGGNIHIPGLLYSYFAQNNFVEHARLEIPDFTFPHEEYIIELDNENIEDKDDLKKFVKSYRSQFIEFESGYFWEAIKRQERQPNKNVFKGKVYLLVGGNSISASSYFIALFKGEGRGVIVGEEVGGSHHSITAGTDITYQLPHTKIKVLVPLMVVHFSDELYEKVPELKVAPDVTLDQDEYYKFFLSKQDPELEKVFQLIKGDNQ